MPKKIEISHRTIIFTVAFLLLLWVLFQVRDIILMLFVSIILMSAFNPAVDWMEKIRLPRGIAILIVYALVWTTIGLIIAGIVPALVDQTNRLIHLIPSAISKFELFNVNQQAITQQLLSQIGTLPENLLKLTVGLFGNLLAVLTTLVMTFYLLLERKHLNKYLSAIWEGDKSARVSKTVNEIERRLGSWIRGELVLMLAVGALTYIGLSVLGVEIALPLAILAGILEIVPNIGPTISAVPAVLVALTIHPLTALATATLYFLVQLVENNLLVPKIMQKAAGVNPLVSIVGLMIGFRLAGPAGAVLAIPIIIVTHIIGLEYFKS